ncbi:hypothetical protein BUPH_08393 (plasmid) [Paraburkholderia phenoliruptrix BR3459a]|uniref:Uncharacterized protein n=1 Tax=Paraburkholderia phenoliruptrix BR3459a TaxID=1229205 RepID=K0DW80_9BURK|nr:hypothetical protein BUPH_08393 [Paraburkholderia phenoliruptrix BR3459a]
MAVQRIVRHSVAAKQRTRAVRVRVMVASGTGPAPVVDCLAMRRLRENSVGLREIPLLDDARRFKFVADHL